MMANDVIRVHCTEAVVEVYADHTRIWFADGGTVDGAPEDTDDYRATAQRHGYGDDTLRLCKEHEVTHIALCHWLGVASPTMQLVRHGTGQPHLNHLEETAVLAVQHFARAAGIDLVARMAEIYPMEITHVE
jgi:hypothetical protein